MTEVQEGTIQANGRVRAADVAQQLEALIADRRQVLAEIDEQRDKIVVALRSYERALQALTDPDSITRRRRASKPAKTDQAQSKRTNATRMSPKRLQEVEAYVRDYAKDHDEFRQVDLRSAHGTFADGATFSSGQSALAFEKLRERNIIRVSRIDGNSKYYRLTRQALQDDRLD